MNTPYPTFMIFKEKVVLIISLNIESQLGY